MAELSLDSAASEAGALRLVMGHIWLVICCPDVAWQQQLQDRYGGFLQTDEAPPSAVTVRVSYSIEGHGVPSPEVLRRARLQGLQRRGSAGGDELWGEGFRALWQPERRLLQIWGPRAVYPLDLLLQVVWYDAHPQTLILHAAALFDGDRGWLCAGPSGSGKSTLAALFPGRVLADELVGLVIEKPGVYLVALPFWQGRPGRLALQAVCCLRHRGAVEPEGAEPHLRRPLATDEALRALRGQVAWPTWDPGAMSRCLETLGRLLETIPVDELAFSPSTTVWPHLIAGRRDVR